MPKKIKEDSIKLNVVYVAEKDNVPICIDGFSVETVATLKSARARLEVTPRPRLPSEKMVPYVSLKDISNLMTEEAEKQNTYLEAVRSVVEKLSELIKDTKVK